MTITATTIIIIHVVVVTYPPHTSYLSRIIPQNATPVTLNGGYTFSHTTRRRSPPYTPPKPPEQMARDAPLSGSATLVACCSFRSSRDGRPPGRRGWSCKLARRTRSTAKAVTNASRAGCIESVREPLAAAPSRPRRQSRARCPYGG